MFNLKKVSVFIFIFLLIPIFHLAWAVEFPFVNKNKIRISVAPGQTKYDDLVVENPTSEEKNIKVYLEDWRYTAANDGAKEFAPANSSPLSCASWLSYSPAEFTVPAYGKQRISYSVKVPKDAMGAHFAVMFLETSFQGGAAGMQGVTAGINLNVRTAVLFYVEAKDTVNRQGMFSNLSLTKASKDDPLKVQIDFFNNGNTDITCTGSFHVMNQEGQIFARSEFNSVYTFPDDKGVLVSTWKEAIPAGKYDLVLTLDLGKALEEAGVGRGPVVIKEAELEIGKNGEVLRVGELR